jgi:phosphoserine phosphatase
MGHPRGDRALTHDRAAAEEASAALERPSGSAGLIPDGLDAVLVLLRHGETEFIVEKRFQGAMEAPLSAAGAVQARLAGERLALPHRNPALPIPDAPPYAIYHSPLGRARKTAEAVAAALVAAGRSAPPLRPHSGFGEIAQGAWEGMKETDIESRYGEELGGWRRWPTTVHAPGGESLDQVVARTADALATMLGELAAGGARGTHDRPQVLGYGDGSPDARRWGLLVGHGGNFRVVMCLLLGIGPEHFWNFDFGLGAITVVEIRAGRAVLRAMNLDGHLDLEAERMAAESESRNERGAL